MFISVGNLQPKAWNDHVSSFADAVQSDFDLASFIHPRDHVICNNRGWSDVMMSEASEVKCVPTRASRLSHI